MTSSFVLHGLSDAFTQWWFFVCFVSCAPLWVFAYHVHHSKPTITLMCLVRAVLWTRKMGSISLGRWTSSWTLYSSSCRYQLYGHLISVPWRRLAFVQCLGSVSCKWFFTCLSGDGVMLRWPRILALIGYRFSLIEKENLDDFIHNGEPPGIYCSLELYLGIISACLPFLSPPIAQLDTKFSRSRLFSYLNSVRHTSRTRLRNDNPSGGDSIEFMDIYRKPQTRKSISVQGALDEEQGVDSTKFVTVPAQWRL